MRAHATHRLARRRRDLSWPAGFFALVATLLPAPACKKADERDAKDEEIVRLKAALAAAQRGPVVDAATEPTIKQLASQGQIEELASQSRIEGLLARFHEDLCENFRLSHYQIVGEGTRRGMPAQLVAYEATAECVGKARRLCGKIAVSYGLGREMFHYVSGFNFIPRQSISAPEGCDEPGTLPLRCHGCGNAKLAGALVKEGYDFSKAAAAVGRRLLDYSTVEFGVRECAEYFAKMRSCMMSMPPKARAFMEPTLMRTSYHWRDAAATAAGRRGLKGACKEAIEKLETSPACK